VAIEYSERYCSACEGITSHAMVDTVDGPKWQCEECGTFEEEDQRCE